MTAAPYARMWRKLQKSDRLLLRTPRAEPCPRPQRSSIHGLQRAAELDLLDAQQAMPVGLIVKAVLERVLGVPFAEEDVDRFGIAGLDERVQAHSRERYSAIHGGASASRCRPRRGAFRAEAQRVLTQPARPPRAAAIAHR